MRRMGASAFDLMRSVRHLSFPFFMDDEPISLWLSSSASTIMPALVYAQGNSVHALQLLF
jgi:hypothetical protein